MSRFSWRRSLAAPATLTGSADLFSAYERRNRLLLPVARPVLSRFAGFTFDGSAPARRELLERMPLVGLMDPAGC